MADGYRPPPLLPNLRRYRMTIPSTIMGTLNSARTPIVGILRRLILAIAVALTMLGLAVSPAAAGSDEHINTNPERAIRTAPPAGGGAETSGTAGILGLSEGP
jgi:hypothetical protein